MGSSMAAHHCPAVRATAPAVVSTAPIFYFTTGETTRKGRNLARDPRCSLGVSTDEFDLAVGAPRGTRRRHSATVRTHPDRRRAYI
jgi:hypothetical protein